MDLTETSQYELHHFCDPAVGAIQPHGTLLDTVLATGRGRDWLVRLVEDSLACRVAIALVIKEAEETAEAIATVDRLMLNVSQWRDIMASVARRAPPERRNALLAASG